MKVGRADWDFPYEPPRRPTSGADEGSTDVVVAMRADVGATALRGSLRSLDPDVVVEPLIARAPLYWTRVRAARHTTPAEVAAHLTTFPVRYVASARSESMALAPPLAHDRAPPAGRTSDTARWPVRRRRGLPAESSASGYWFLGDRGGIGLSRRVCGTGAGTRLAVIDDEAADVEHLELDALTCVGVAQAPATTGHSALMIAWATGTAPANGARFAGVAPDASTRLYCIPKPGTDVVSLPLAIARAVFDGADVIVCATYVEGTNSPLLDDALDVAVHLGRRGRGTAVVFPTGREAASPGDSIHASLSLGFGDPASDPRVHCIAPGGRAGGWFLWKNPRGSVRPFANRGPAVRWMTPGDDIVYPFLSRDRLFHAESSGASAIAAGVMLLVLGCNPALRLRDLHTILAQTVEPPSDDGDVDSLADPADVLPPVRDRDGHNAKSGYGRLHATRACACARDPIALQLVMMGDDALAASWCVQEHPYSGTLARWAVRACLRRPEFAHAVRVVLRHLRLVAAQPSRARAHARGALGRHVALLVREMSRMHAPRSVREELARAAAGLEDRTTPEALLAFEQAVLLAYGRVEGKAPPSAPDPVFMPSIRS